MFFDEIAEYRLLGSFIDNPSYTFKVTRDLFSGERQYVYDAMRKTYAHYGEISSEGVARFYGKDLPQTVEVSRGSKPDAIIDRLIDLATKRQLADLQNRLTLILAQGDVDRKELHEVLQLDPVIYTEDSSITPGIDRYVAITQQKRNGDYRFVSTGMRWMDAMMGGEWNRQGLTVIAGKSGGGKTALICQSALNMARTGTPVYIASLEMPRDKLVARFVANMASVDGNQVKMGVVSKDDQQRMNDALMELQTLPIFIEDDPGLNVDQIIYSIKSHAKNKGIRAFFVDYLQLIGNADFSSDENTARLYGYLCHRLRTTAVQEDISGIILSQQNRGFKGLDSLLGSGRIGNIADTVIELHADDSISDNTRQYMFEWLKNREGPIGSVGPIIYRPRFLRFDAD